MARNHYETLGLKRGASQTEIKSAYRKLVLLYHPDRSRETGSLEMFHRVTEAYQVLSNLGKKLQYDRLLELNEMTQEAPTSGHEARPKAKPYAATGKAARSVAVSAEVSRLTVVHSRGQTLVAERLAQKILGYDSKQPIPYAVLGDISRAKGDLKHAAKMYALAVQMDPANELYHQRHEEMVSLAVTSIGRRTERDRQKKVALWGGSIMLFLALIYLVVSREEAIAPTLGFISTWTLGVVVMSFLSGVVLGSCMCYAGFLDRFFSVATTALGRVTPVVALATIAIVNFWVAGVLYVLLGLAQSAFNYSTTRMVMAVAGLTVVLAFAANLSWSIDPMQVLVWGGNLVYIGALSGWMVADSMRE